MYETQAELEAFFKCLYHFRLVKKLGEGHFGIAVLVYDDAEKEHKVFKFPKDTHTTEALRQEGENLKALQQLSHPNIIRLYQYGWVPLEWKGSVEERHYLNMAFGGTSLRAKLGQLRYELDENGNAVYFGSGKRLPMADVLRVAIDCCRGLEAAHGFQGAAVRMLHRDISPDNILVDDVTGVARLSDFGIARVIDRSTALGSIAGKLIYMDPECFLCRASFQSDLYSLAIVLYEAATGQLPFGNYQQRVAGPPRPLEELAPEVPREFSAIVLKALNSDVKARFRNASEMLAELVRLRARLNPLPSRYQRLATLADGRFLCEDGETGERVAVRLLTSPVTEAEFAQQRRLIQSLDRPMLEASLRDFRNEYFVGIVSPVPGDPTLADRFGGADLRQVDTLKLLCEVVIDVCEQLDAAHQLGIHHGLLSPLAVTLPPSGTRIHELGLGPVLRLRRASGNAEEFFEVFRSLTPFLSPQIRHGASEPNPRDDVYGVGAILWSVFSGQPPAPPPAPATPENLAEPGRHLEQRKGLPLPHVQPALDARALAQSVARADPKPDAVSALRETNPFLPERLLEVVRRCLDPQPRGRPASLAEVAAAIGECRWPDDAVEALCADALRLYPLGAGDAALIQACDRITLALRLDPGNPTAHYTRGLVYVRNGSFSWAAKDLDKAARVRPGVEVLGLLGEAYEKAGQPAQAEKAYRKALELGDDPKVRERLTALVRERNQKTPPPPSAWPATAPLEQPSSSAWPETAPPPASVQPAPPETGSIRTCLSCREVLPPGLLAGHGDNVCLACRSDPLGMASRLLHERGYQIVRELGRGGMGVVYLAQHEHSGEHLAVKTMHPQVAVGPKTRDLFLREVETTKALRHPHCVQLRDSHCLGGVFFFTMEYCEGGSVEDLRKQRGGTLSLDEAGEIVLQALQGLHYAHTLEIATARRADGQQARGLVHRDLKPHNLFLTGTGSARIVKIGDFGLAKAFDLAGVSGNTQTGTTAGTPFFMPRQQALDYKYAEPEVDVWAMAATFYYLLAGLPPRDFRTNKGKLQVVLEDDPVPLLKRCPTVPQRVAEIIDLALVDRPALLFKSAASFKELLENVL
jgi:serine/threonine protein kinase